MHVWLTERGRGMGEGGSGGDEKGREWSRGY